MRQLTSIVAVGHDGAIGAKNRLPWRVKSDLQFFRKATENQIVIMGRRTLDSLGRCLPNRQNIVLSHTFGLVDSQPNCQFSASIEETLFAADRGSTLKRQPFVIGGATMYEQFAPYVDRYLITFVDIAVANADTFFKIEWLGDLANWKQEVLVEGVADGVQDEANFKVVEYTAVEPALIARRRHDVIAKLHAKRQRTLDLSTFGAAYAAA